jgi:hypothetical protein
MLAAGNLLEIWEQSRDCSAVHRNLHLLAAALPDHDRDALARFDLALRDWHLLRLYAEWFGSWLDGYIDCPSCGERLEIRLDAKVIGAECPAAPVPYVSRDGRRFRLPNSADLIAIAGVRDSEAAARQLFERTCLDRATDAHDPTLYDEVDEGLEALASDRTVRIDVSCELCGHGSSHALTPAEFLWTAIATRATTLMDDIHRLASSYGWSERDILEMSEVRRRAYVSRLPI